MLIEIMLSKILTLTLYILYIYVVLYICIYILYCIPIYFSSYKLYQRKKKIIILGTILKNIVLFAIHNADEIN